MQRQAVQRRLLCEVQSESGRGPFTETAARLCSSLKTLNSGSHLLSRCLLSQGSQASLGSTMSMALTFEHTSESSAGSAHPRNFGCSGPWADPECAFLTSSQENTGAAGLRSYYKNHCADTFVYEENRQICNHTQNCQ